MFVVYNLRETYHELGEYEFKVVLDPRSFKHGHDSSVAIFDSDGKEMRSSVRRWGRKITCSFVIDRHVSDGVSTVKMSLIDASGSIRNCRLSFWVIKP